MYFEYPTIDAANQAFPNWTSRQDEYSIVLTQNQEKWERCLKGVGMIALTIITGFVPMVIAILCSRRVRNYWHDVFSNTKVRHIRINEPCILQTETDHRQVSGTSTAQESPQERVWDSCLQTLNFKKYVVDEEYANTSIDILQREPDDPTEITRVVKKEIKECSKEDLLYLFVTKKKFVFDIRTLIHKFNKIYRDNLPITDCFNKELICSSKEQFEALCELETHFIGTHSLSTIRAEVILEKTYYVEECGLLETTIDNSSLLSNFLSDPSLDGYRDKWFEQIDASSTSQVSHLMMCKN